MIYLIGGPPKCGKTTFACSFARSAKISFLSTDTLQSAISGYVNKKDIKSKFPLRAARAETGRSNDRFYNKHNAQQIIALYRRQTKTLLRAINSVIDTYVTDSRDVILEGYHIEPILVLWLQKKYGKKIRAVFLLKKDPQKFLKNFHKSVMPHDWIIERTVQNDTYEKIAQMIACYSDIIEREAVQHQQKVFVADDHFSRTLTEVKKYLTKP